MVLQLKGRYLTTVTLQITASGETILNDMLHGFPQYLHLHFELYLNLVSFCDG